MHAASVTPPSGNGSHRLYLQVLAAVALGVALGHLAPGLATALQPLGNGFIALVKMVIAPLIFLTVTTGIAGMAGPASAGRVAGRALLYFLVMSTAALFVGLAVGNLVRPGAGLHVDPHALDSHAVSGFVAAAEHHDMVAFFLGIIPATTASAFTSGNVLQVLLVAILFGVSLSRMGERGERVLSLFRSLTELTFGVVDIVMKFAPIGAFGAIAFTIGRFGLHSVVDLALLVGSFYITAILFVTIALGLVARACGFSILRLLVYLRDELLIVLGTSSSEAALPSLMSKLERAGASPSVVGLVVPMGYSFNLDGTNIYMTLASLFIAQATGIHLSFGDQMTLLAVAMISSKGAAGVSGAGFVTLAATLSVVPSVPVGGMALILGVDRFMSECRSLTNVTGNAVATLVVARWEGVLDMTRLNAVLHRTAHTT
ncbi:sodium:dicarboxylate symporter [Ameyamaea chiangmaiensis NBRC 103196]|uniref:C4-dicarboxylate transporter DctA n=1 Tax=Ameyamaea chiangmaiensis TaxID=442969 RepID=A0A850P5K8_9PROT|nr:C4-dicarboxylate transporter DctA [Ameyamaea chiangmaiensis]MBS4074161.1 C4-dicarboxylate transporter DctA [Ameyamaea chiangmaiensis]NVN39104.1 C4-dicarboxylate transporter DctA [Ameyamaea chiangmaiensis]GBQ71089.1 sodium:dicarboxylate symporter [Ameyamaea chiangmaiensis NBRC 103196]